MLKLESPDKIDGVPARLILFPSPMRNRKNLEKERAWLRKQLQGFRDFKQMPMKTARVGAFPALTYSETSHGYYMPPVMGARPQPDPVPVLRRRTFVYFAPSSSSSIEIQYEAPASIYEKYAEDFQQMLKTFHWLKTTPLNGKGK